VAPPLFLRWCVTAAANGTNVQTYTLRAAAAPLRPLPIVTTAIKPSTAVQEGFPQCSQINCPYSSYYQAIHLTLARYRRFVIPSVRPCRRCGWTRMPICRPPLLTQITQIGFTFTRCLTTIVRANFSRCWLLYFTRFFVYILLTLSATWHSISRNLTCLCPNRKAA